MRYFRLTALVLLSCCVFSIAFSSRAFPDECPLIAFMDKDTPADRAESDVLAQQLCERYTLDLSSTARLEKGAFVLTDELGIKEYAPKEYLEDSRRVYGTGVFNEDYEAEVLASKSAVDRFVWHFHSVIHFIFRAQTAGSSRYSEGISRALLAQAYMRLFTLCETDIEDGLLSNAEIWSKWFKLSKELDKEFKITETLAKCVEEASAKLDLSVDDPDFLAKWVTEVRRCEGIFTSTALLDRMFEYGPAKLLRNPAALRFPVERGDKRDDFFQRHAVPEVASLIAASLADKSDSALFRIARVLRSMMILAMGERVMAGPESSFRFDLLGKLLDVRFCVGDSMCRAVASEEFAKLSRALRREDFRRRRAGFEGSYRLKLLTTIPVSNVTFAGSGAPPLPEQKTESDATIPIVFAVSHGFVGGSRLSNYSYHWRDYAMAMSLSFAGLTTWSAYFDIIRPEPPELLTSKADLALLEPGDPYLDKKSWARYVQGTGITDAVSEDTLRGDYTPCMFHEYAEAEARVYIISDYEAELDEICFEFAAALVIVIPKEGSQVRSFTGLLHRDLTHWATKCGSNIRGFRAWTSVEFEGSKQGREVRARAEELCKERADENGERYKESLKYRKMRLDEVNAR